MAQSPFNNIEKMSDSDEFEDLLAQEAPEVEESDEEETPEMEDEAEYDTEAIDFSANLAEYLDEKTLNRIASDLDDLITDDDRSRDEWKKVYEKGMVLLGLTYEDRTEPFDGATGVTHPILNEAVTQFQAQAYKELLPSGGPVRTTIIGKVTPEREAQAERVKTFMNYQITQVWSCDEPVYPAEGLDCPVCGPRFVDSGACHARLEVFTE